MNNNQYHPQEEAGPNGGLIIAFYDGEDRVFETTEIPEKFRLLGNMIYSTLEVAVSFGFVKQPDPENRT